MNVDKKGFQEDLTFRMARRLHLPMEAIRPDVPFDQFGLDSLTVVSLVAEIEEELGLEIDPSWLYEFRTLESLSERLFATGGAVA